MSDLHRVRHWAEALIELHLDPSWTFAFDNAKRRAGLCDYTRKRISVSRYLAARYDDDAKPPDPAARGRARAGRCRRGSRPAVEGDRPRPRLRRRHNASRRDRHRARAVGRHLPVGARRLSPSPLDPPDVVRQVRTGVRRAVPLLVDAPRHHARDAPRRDDPSLTGLGITASLDAARRRPESRMVRSRPRRRTTRRTAPSPARSRGGSCRFENRVPGPSTRPQNRRSTRP